MPFVAADFTFKGARIELTVSAEKKVVQAVLQGQASPKSFDQATVPSDGLKVSFTLTPEQLAKIEAYVLQNVADKLNGPGAQAAPLAL